MSAKDVTEREAAEEVMRKESWLLIKHHDEYVKLGYDANTFDFSAISNRSLAEIAANQEEAVMV